MKTITKAKVKLTGIDGNAYAILGAAKRAMRLAKVDEAIINQYWTEATSGDYDHLIQTTMKYCEVS